MSIGEFELIKQYFLQSAGAYGVNQGIGDDCALLTVPEGKQLAVSMDTLVGGIHFPKNADPELIAERALRVNLSDLAAMGAEPLWFTLGLTMPEADSHWLQGFSQGLFHVAGEYNCALVGGDTTRGPLSITIQVHGSVEPEKALLRSEARKGDLVMVTGTLGDGAAALAVIKRELEVGSSAFQYFMQRFYKPEPQIKVGKELGGIASAALDISDGLVSDLGHICEESGVGARIDLNRLPISDPVRHKVDLEKAIYWALCGGDDYQLCFTVAPEKMADVEALIEKGHLQASVIGEITDGDGVSCVNRGKPVHLPSGGYKHF